MHRDFLKTRTISSRRAYFEKSSKYTCTFDNRKRKRNFAHSSSYDDIGSILLSNCFSPSFSFMTKSRLVSQHLILFFRQVPCFFSTLFAIKCRQAYLFENKKEKNNPQNSFSSKKTIQQTANAERIEFRFLFSHN